MHRSEGGHLRGRLGDRFHHVGGARPARALATDRAPAVWAPGRPLDEASGREPVTSLVAEGVRKQHWGECVACVRALFLSARWRFADADRQTQPRNGSRAVPGATGCARRAGRPRGAMPNGRCEITRSGATVCMWTRRLDAVEASSGGERRALGYLGQVLVEKHAGDELLARSDADLVVEALGVVLDRVRREDQRLGDLDAR
jgi:hypothetical protein